MTYYFWCFFYSLNSPTGDVPSGCDYCFTNTKSCKCRKTSCRHCRIDKRICNLYNKSRNNRHDPVDLARGDEMSMKYIRRRITTLAAIGVVLIPLLVTIYLLY